MNEKNSRWDSVYSNSAARVPGKEIPLPTFIDCAEQFPARGRCLEIACGQGQTAVWLARRGMDVYGVDLSPVAIAQARMLATNAGVSEHCHFEVHDLDAGLPDTPPVDLLLCHKFRDTRLYPAMKARLAPGGMLAIVVLSEVDAKPGRFRAKAGELQHAFGGMQIVSQGEKDGLGWLVGRMSDATSGKN